MGGFAIWHSAVGPAILKARLFLVFTYIWQEDLAKISKVPGTPCNVNPAQLITWLVSVTIYCTIFNDDFIHLASFYVTIYV